MDGGSRRDLRLAPFQVYTRIGVGIGDIGTRCSVGHVSNILRPTYSGEAIFQVQVRDIEITEWSARRLLKAFKLRQRMPVHAFLIRKLPNRPRPAADVFFFPLILLLT